VSVVAESDVELAESDEELAESELESQAACNGHCPQLEDTLAGTVSTLSLIRLSKCTCLGCSVPLDTLSSCLRTREPMAV